MTDEELQPFFASDLAGEVRQSFRSALAGHTLAEATRLTLADFQHLLEDPREGPIVFIALAAVQLGDGPVHPFIRETALELIRAGETGPLLSAGDGTLRRQRAELLRQFELALDPSADDE